MPRFPRQLAGSTNLCGFHSYPDHVCRPFPTSRESPLCLHTVYLNNIIHTRSDAGPRTPLIRTPFCPNGVRRHRTPLIRTPFCPNGVRRQRTPLIKTPFCPNGVRRQRTPLIRTPFCPNGVRRHRTPLIRTPFCPNGVYYYNIQFIPLIPSFFLHFRAST